MNINVIHDDRTDADADRRNNQKFYELITDDFSNGVKGKLSVDQITGGKSKRNGYRLRLETLQSAKY